MSFDFATAQICPHEVFFERLALDDADRNFAFFLQPPNSQRVDVYVDGEMVPPTGLFSYAELPFTRPEPYRIKTGVNDLIYIAIGFEAPRLIQLVPGPNLRAVDVARDLQLKLPGLFVEAKNRRVVFRSHQRVNGTAFSFPDPRWTDPTSSLTTTVRVLGGYGAVGINPGRHVYGRELFPGWTVTPNPADPLQFQRRVFFNKPIVNADPVIEVNYVTNQANCRRCHGSRVEFDYSIMDGTYETVENTDLMAQEFEKFVFTKVGSHWKWNWLGSKLVDRIGSKGDSGSVTANALITVDITEAFRTYQNIKQQQDSRFPFQDVTDAEYPAQLSNMEVTTLPDDPTVAVVTIVIVSKSREGAELKRVVGNPNPFTLLNDPRSNIRDGNRGNFRLRG